MTENKYQQCSRCVMDTTDPEIVFDDNGWCNYCTEYIGNTSKRTYQGAASDEQLQQLVDKIKKAGKGNQYDCLIGVSGGIDSSYTAYVAKKFGLRALLVHMDNGWNSEISVKNIKNIADLLGFDYQSCVLDWEEFKDLQLSFLKASVPEPETPTDIAMLGVLHQIADEHKIKFVISGGNFATEGILPRIWHYNSKDSKYMLHIHNKFGTKKLKTFPLFTWYQEIYYKFFKGIRIVYLLNYLPFSKSEAMQLLEKELGWKYYGGKHYESKYTGFVQSYILPVKFHIDYRRATFSTQICTGEITREDALKRLETLSYNPDKVREEIDYVCKKLDITTGEFEAIMKERPKWYYEYPNDEKFLNFLYNLYRKLF